MIYLSIYRDIAPFPFSSVQILQLQEPLQHHHRQLQEPLNQQPPKPLPQPPALHHAKKLINESNPWNENSTKNDKLELLKSKPCSNNSTKNDKLELMILNESNPWNENSIKNDKLELLKSKLCSNSSIKNDSLSNKNNKLESLPKTPSATSKLKVLPDA